MVDRGIVRVGFAQMVQNLALDREETRVFETLADRENKISAGMLSRSARARASQPRSLNASENVNRAPSSIKSGLDDGSRRTASRTWGKVRMP